MDDERHEVCSDTIEDISFSFRLKEGEKIVAAKVFLVDSIYMKSLAFLVYSEEGPFNLLNE